MSKTHKSFQPVLACGNKLLQQKWDQTYYDDHKKLVKAAKPMIDSKPPPARPHVTSKLKKLQLERERLEEIDRDNMTLLKKMQHIMKTEGNVDHHSTSHQYRHSLNQEKRQREVQRVARENRQLLERLEKVEPMYKVSSWIEDWQRKGELTNMITAYPEASTGATIPVANKIKKDTAKEKDVVEVMETEEQKQQTEQQAKEEEKESTTEQ